MKIAFTPNARDDLERRIAYTIEHFGKRTANKLYGRVDTFINKTLAQFPFTGKVHSSGLLESWIPRTPFLVIYRVDVAADTLTVLAVFHHAQDRREFVEKS